VSKGVGPIGDGVYKVDELRACRKNSYLVHWTGWSDEADSWVHKRDISKDLIKHFHNVKNFKWQYRSHKDENKWYDFHASNNKEVEDFFTKWCEDAGAPCYMQFTVPNTRRTYSVTVGDKFLQRNIFNQKTRIIRRIPS